MLAGPSARKHPAFDLGPGVIPETKDLFLGDATHYDRPNPCDKVSVAVILVVKQPPDIPVAAGDVTVNTAGDVGNYLGHAIFLVWLAHRIFRSAWW